MNFLLRSDITQTDYTKFGTTSNDLFGDGTLYDFIDTTVYVQGLSTNATVQLPVRIIKLAQTYSEKMNACFLWTIKRKHWCDNHEDNSSWGHPHARNGYKQWHIQQQ